MEIEHLGYREGFAKNRQTIEENVMELRSSSQCMTFTHEARLSSLVRSVYLHSKARRFIGLPLLMVQFFLAIAHRPYQQHATKYIQHPVKTFSIALPLGVQQNTIRWLNSNKEPRQWRASETNAKLEA